MNKQKQIAEMAKVVCECCIENEEFTCEFVSQPCIFAKTFAETSYNKGYRKLDDHAIMALRKAKDMEERIRKETAEKFAELVKMAFYYHFDELIPSIMADKIDEICKEITEGKV